jgi:hypothetical protein
MIGRRINPATGETIEVPEADHFYRCESCGGLVDMRNLEAVCAHEGPAPHPKEDMPQ